jgi:hypothetical protein
MYHQWYSGTDGTGYPLGWNGTQPTTCTVVFRCFRTLLATVVMKELLYLEEA